MHFWFRRRRSDRQQALDAIAAIRRHPLIKPGRPRTTGSVNDEYWAKQAWLAGYGQP